MAFRKHNPGCPCCDPCKLDDFTAEVEIDTESSKTIRSAQHPQSPYPSWLTLDLKADATATARVYFLWDDGTPGGGVYLELTPDSPMANSGAITVYTKDGTAIAGPWYVAGAVSGVWHSLTICYDPDTEPNEFVISFDPDGTTYPVQAFNVLLPSGTVVGRYAGYGTGAGSGSAWFRNYQFDRLWYCGTSPFTLDCNEQCDEFDYYYDLPTRTTCHSCERCPAGPRTNGTGDWNLVSGSWASNLSTTSSNAIAIAVPGQSNWQVGIGSGAWLHNGDEASLGWSDQLGQNMVYVVFSHNMAGSLGYTSISSNVIYDEEYDRFYFSLTAATSAHVLSTSTITYSVYSITNGGAPSLIKGPVTLTATIRPGPANYIVGDDYVTLHAEMRHVMFGTGTVSNGVLFAGAFNQCVCGGGTSIPKVPRKYTGAVAGVVGGGKVGTELGTDFYFEEGYLNQSGSMRNYYHLTNGITYTPCEACCHQLWGEVRDPRFRLWAIRFYGFYNGCTTELHGYAYSLQQLGAYGGSYAVELHFKKVAYEKLDLRNLSGVELPFYSMACAGGTTCDWVDASNATFTVTSVP